MFQVQQYFFSVQTLDPKIQHGSAHENLTFCLQVSIKRKFRDAPTIFNIIVGPVSAVTSILAMKKSSEVILWVRPMACQISIHLILFFRLIKQLFVLKN